MLKSLEEVIGDKLALGVSDPEGFAAQVAAHAAATLPRQVSGKDREFRVSPSNYGSPCVRKLWLQARDTEGIPLTPAARIKFMFGDLVEALAIPLLKEVAEVTHVQQPYKVELDGIELSGVGDCVVDGYTCDVKSMSKYSFRDWTSGSVDDKFGYRWQLSAYNAMRGIQDQTVVPDVGYIIAVEKELGHVAAVEVPLYTKDEVAARLRTVHQQVDDDTPPARLPCEPDGKSGNEKLGIACSYCEFRKVCWPEARTFLYAGNKPVHLTKVERVPNVPEVA